MDACRLDYSWRAGAKKNPLRTKPGIKHPCFVLSPMWTRWVRRQGSTMNSLRSPLTPPPARGRGSAPEIVLDTADDIIDALAASVIYFPTIIPTPRFSKGVSSQVPDTVVHPLTGYRASSRRTWARSGTLYFCNSSATSLPSFTSSVRTSSQPS